MYGEKSIHGSQCILGFIFYNRQQRIPYVGVQVYWVLFFTTDILKIIMEGPYVEVSYLWGEVP